MKGGCLIAGAFAGTAVVTWIVIAIVLLGGTPPSSPGDNGGTAMGIAGILIEGWGLYLALFAGLVAGLLVWARRFPKE